jgi:hypothetical protein
MLRSPSVLSRVMAFALAIFLVSPGNGGEAVSDPAITTYGVLNPAAPPELGLFAFLVGTWSGTARARGADGTYTDYEFDWIGRYALDGMAIADEMRMSAAQGGAIQGMSLRFFDAGTQSWVIEFLNFSQRFLRKQVNTRVGAVTQDGAQVTVAQTGPDGGPGREVYTVVDADHFTYRMDFSQDGGQRWDEGVVTIDMRRVEGQSASGPGAITE